MVKFYVLCICHNRKSERGESEVEVGRVTWNMRNGLGWTSSRPLGAGLLGLASVSLYMLSPLQQLVLTFRHWGGSVRRSGPAGRGHSPPPGLGGKAHAASCGSVAEG